MNKNTKEKILESAREVFLINGFAGARMRDIAEKANINKGLLHYYFKTKRLLFLEVLKILVVSFAPQVDSIFGMQLSLFEKIELFVDKYIDMLCRNKQIPFFIVHEINLNADEFLSFILEIDEMTSLNPITKFQQFQEEIDKGNIKDINPIHLILNVISLSVFPFIARPGIQKLTGMSDENFIRFMKLMKRVIVDTIISSIKK